MVDDLPSFPRPMFALSDTNIKTKQAPFGLAMLGLTFGAAGVLGSPSFFHAALAVSGAAFLGAAYAAFVWLSFPTLDRAKARAFAAWYAACAFAWAILFPDVAMMARSDHAGPTMAHLALCALLGLEAVYSVWATTIWSRTWRRCARAEIPGR